MGFWDSFGKLLGGTASGAASGTTAPVVGILNVVKGLADKIWMGKAESEQLSLSRDQFTAATTHALLELKQQGDISEYGDEADRRRDVRESGWLSRQVRPVIALTFHFFFWWFLVFRNPQFKETMSVKIFKVFETEITVGAMYVLIVCFYFLTKGIKDYFMSKNPLSHKQGML